jgi:serine/threonine protein kinase
MGVVYRANDTRLGRVVALKFLLPHYNLDASAKARFLREAHAAAALDHPNLCTIHEVGTSDEGCLFLAMALYPGETLRDRLARNGSIPLREALDIAPQIVQGLQAAHAAGIVHRDLKPGNVMLLPDGTVRILDFGLAKARDHSRSETGVRFGTVSYMSPEQIRGGNVDGRSDLWSLGVVFYEMLTRFFTMSRIHSRCIETKSRRCWKMLFSGCCRRIPSTVMTARRSCSGSSAEFAHSLSNRLRHGRAFFRP